MGEAISVAVFLKFSILGLLHTRGRNKDVGLLVGIFQHTRKHNGRQGAEAYLITDVLQMVMSIRSYKMQNKCQKEENWSCYREFTTKSKKGLKEV
uniref:Uncharacterized protein n=1 Tax=Strigamia maritima TaxID=126957 RepID=T1JJX8_STRMM